MEYRSWWWMPWLQRFWLAGGKVLFVTLELEWKEKTT